MFSHVMLGANDVDKSRAFYDAVLGALGAKSGRVDDKGRVYYTHNGGLFMISKPIDGEAACHATGGTVGFAGASPDAVDAWHAAGLASGGTHRAYPPGSREGGSGDSYSGSLPSIAGKQHSARYNPPPKSTPHPP